MSDPDMGRWTYGYNALGELISQTDAKGQTVGMVYDLLGRMTRRTESEGTTSWSYDTAVKGKGKLHRVAGPGGYARTHGYDALGRAQSETIYGETFRTSRSYDSSGPGVDAELPQGRVRSGADVHGHGASRVGVQGGYARDGVLAGRGSERGGADHRGDLGERSGDDPELRCGDGSHPHDPVGGGGELRCAGPGLQVRQSGEPDHKGGLEPGGVREFQLRPAEPAHGRRGVRTRRTTASGSPRRTATTRWGTS